MSSYLPHTKIGDSDIWFLDILEKVKSIILNYVGRVIASEAKVVKIALSKWNILF
jgi:hypothetical protein